MGEFKRQAIVKDKDGNTLSIDITNDGEWRTISPDIFPISLIKERVGQPRLFVQGLRCAASSA